MSASRAGLHKSTDSASRDTLREKTATQIQFQLIYVNHGVRQPASGTGWRRLPATLMETPLGGTWELGLRGRSQPVMVNQGEVLVVPSGVEHRLTFRGPGAGHTHYLLGRYLWMSGLDVLRLARIPTVIPEGRALVAAFRRMTVHAGRSAGDIGAVADLQVEAFRVLTRVLRHGKTRHFEKPDRAVARILPVLRFIQDHPRESLTVAALADYVDLSPTRFHALFKQVMGQAPVFYLQAVRCTQACQDLIHTDLTAAEISERCGFASPFYFSRLFRKVIGQTPLEFRRAFQTGGPDLGLGHLSNRTG